jgi:glucose-1-phosphatase
MPRNSPIQAVIFDLGGVLIELDFDGAVRSAARRLKLPAEEVHRRVFGGGDFYGPHGLACMADYECGRMTDAEFHHHVESRLERPLPFDAFYRLWNAIFGKQLTPNVKLARALLRRADLKVGILSNTNALHCRFLRKRLPVFNEFEYRFLSHEIGCRKPDPAAFRHALRDMGVAPRQAVFIDDSAPNIAAARKVGLHGLHAVNAAAVREGLAALGVIED